MRNDVEREKSSQRERETQNAEKPVPQIPQNAYSFRDKQHLTFSRNHARTTLEGLICGATRI
jgi:hypothetical protein